MSMHYNPGPRETLEAKELAPHKGYGVDKAWYENEDGDRVTNYFYLVFDEDRDYVGEEYNSLAEAHKAIDSWI